MFSVDSDLATPPTGVPQSGDYQVWVTQNDGATATLISGAINDPSDPTGITPGSDCYDPTLSADGAFIAFRCKKKQHPSGYQPDSTGDDEGWLYDRTANKLSMFAELNTDGNSACAGSSTSKADLLIKLQDYWGDDSMYNLTDKGVSVTSAMCPFFAAVGLQTGVNTIGVGSDNPSMDAAGRFVAYTTNFQTATAFGTHDSRLPVTEANIFLYDRLLGITTRVTVPPSISAVVGREVCKPSPPLIPMSLHPVITRRHALDSACPNRAPRPLGRRVAKVRVRRGRSAPAACSIGSRARAVTRSRAALAR